MGCESDGTSDHPHQHAHDAGSRAGLITMRRRDYRALNWCRDAARVDGSGGDSACGSVRRWVTGDPF